MRTIVRLLASLLGVHLCCAGVGLLRWAGWRMPSVMRVTGTRDDVAEARVRRERRVAAVDERWN